MMTKRRWKILLVEDKEDDLEALAELLRYLEYEVLTARDGREAIPLLTQFPDLVITNLLMPRVDGFELLEYMKQHCPNIPAIMTSGGFTEERMAEAKALGAVYCIHKPLGPDDWERIEELLPPCWWSTPEQ
jgi:CheY-like chemotaxis protein